MSANKRHRCLVSGRQQIKTFCLLALSDAVVASLVSSFTTTGKRKKVKRWQKGKHRDVSPHFARKQMRPITFSFYTRNNLCLQLFLARKIISSRRNNLHKTSIKVDDRASVSFHPNRDTTHRRLIYLTIFFKEIFFEISWFTCQGKCWQSIDVELACDFDSC